MTEIEDFMTIEKSMDRSNEEVGLSWTLLSPRTKDRRGIKEIVPKSSRVHMVTEGNELIDRLVETVNSATEVVCVSSFLIQGSDFTESLNRAHERGVRVYILTAGEEDLKMTDEDGSPSIQRVKEFNGLLSGLSERVFLRTGDFHAKFILIDPHLKTSAGIMTTCNMTKDAMSGINKELYVSLTGSEINSFFNQFMKGLWFMSRHELRNRRLVELEIEKFVPKTPIPETTEPSTLDGSKSLYETIKSILNGATKEIVISAWTFTDEVEIPEILSKSLDKGLSVKIFTRPNYLNGVTISHLKEKGAEVYAHERFHAKAIIVDSEKSLVTTANFSIHGLEDGFETGVLLGRNDSKALLEIFEIWREECKWTLSLSSTISMLSGKVRIVDRITEEIVEKTINDEARVTLKDMQYDEVKRQEEVSLDIESQMSNDTIVKRFVYICKVKQPILPKQATKTQENNESLGVYRLPGKNKTFVPISQWEDLDKARLIAEKYKAKVVKLSK